MDSEPTDSKAIWKRLRDVVADDNMFRLNIGDPTEVDQEAYAEKLLTDGVATVSDWGLARRADIFLAEDGAEISPDTLIKPYGDHMTGKISWTTIRDDIHNEFHSDRDTKVKAGQATGCIRTFVDDMDAGDLILGNFPDGIIPGRVAGPAIYDHTSEYEDMAPHHVIYRDVEWAIVDDSPLIVSPDLLPPGFGPGRRTVEQVNDPAPLVELLRPIEWLGEKA